MKLPQILLFLRIVRNSLLWPIEIPYNLYLKTMDLSKLWIQQYEYPLKWYVAEAIFLIIGFVGGYNSTYSFQLFISSYLSGVVVRVIMRYMPRPDKAYFTITLVIMTFICGLFYAAFAVVLYDTIIYISQML